MFTVGSILSFKAAVSARLRHWRCARSGCGHVCEFRLTLVDSAVDSPG